MEHGTYEIEFFSDKESMLCLNTHINREEYKLTVQRQLYL